MKNKAIAFLTLFCFACAPIYSEAVFDLNQRESTMLAASGLFLFMSLKNSFCISQGYDEPERVVMTVFSYQAFLTLLLVVIKERRER